MPKKNVKEITVLVTGVGGGGHGEQVVKALRLAKRPYTIVGCDMRPYSSGFADVDIAYQVPGAGDKDYTDILLKICEKHNIKAVFHGSEAEMMAFDQAREQFRAKDIYLPINPTHVLKICQNKVSTSRFLREHGFSVPEFREVITREDLEGFEHLPAVLKPSLRGGGSKNVFIAQTREELHQFASYLLSMSSRVIVQAYVGNPDQEYTVGVLFGADGTLLNSIAVHRFMWTAMSISVRVPNQTRRVDLGETLVISSGISQGKVGRFPMITSECEKIASTLGPTAPINIQCRYVDGKVVVFEINPRFSGTTSLRAIADYNEPDTLIRRDVLGEHVEPHFNYEECVIMRGLSETKLANNSAANGRDFLK